VIWHRYAQEACLICSNLARRKRNHVYSFGIQDQGVAVAARTIVLKLNQQQLELIDRTIAKGAAADRAALVKRAVREHAARHGK
jgi:plasmid stabilization system protein ParE